MFLNSMVKALNGAFHSFNDYDFDKVDPNIIRYFRTEYGKNWKVALQHHLYKQSLKNNKKAA